MIMPDIEPLCAGLEHLGLHITIETAATVFRPVKLDLAKPLAEAEQLHAALIAKADASPKRTSVSASTSR
jgi:hypothetical protein